MKRVTGLYGITVDADAQTESKVLAALKGGCRVIQYRDKNSAKIERLRMARKLKQSCEENDALLIINDDVELASLVDADGVHVGRHDESLQAARVSLPHKIIGVSCYNQLQLALQAEQQGADYVAFGRFFPSHTKPNAVHADIDLLHDAKQKLEIPIVAIGGITINNAALLIEAGADAVAVIHGLFQQDDIETAAKRFTEKFKG